jgi:hypothetical protein
MLIPFNSVQSAEANVLYKRTSSLVNYSALPSHEASILLNDNRPLHIGVDAAVVGKRSGRVELIRVCAARAKQWR